MKFKSLILMVLLLAVVLTVGSVSAMDANSTDDAVAVEQNDDIAVDDGGAQAVSVDDGDDLVSADDGSAESLAVADDGGNVLSSDSAQTTSGSSSQSGKCTKTITKWFYMGQLKIPKKYKKYFLKDYKPSKKNKKAWKEYNAFQKVYKKQLKVFRKYVDKIFYKYMKNKWTFKKFVLSKTSFSSKTFKYKIKTTKKNILMKFYGKGYKTVQC